MGRATLKWKMISDWHLDFILIRLDTTEACKLKPSVNEGGKTL